MRSFFVFAARGMLLNKLSFAGTEELLHRFTRFVLTVLFLNAFAGCGDLTHRCRRRRCADLLRTAVFHLSAIALSVRTLKTKAPSPKNPGRELYRIYYIILFVHCAAALLVFLSASARAGVVRADLYALADGASLFAAV